MKRIKLEGLTKSGKPRGMKFEMSEREYSRLDGQGLCCGCGAEADGVEPDARGYTCESCDEPRVYGAEELLLFGRIVLT